MSQSDDQFQFTWTDPDGNVSVTSDHVYILDQVFCWAYDRGYALALGEENLQGDQTYDLIGRPKFHCYDPSYENRHVTVKQVRT